MNIIGFVTSQDTDLSESEESFESEFNIKYHNKDEEKRAGKITDITFVFFSLLISLQNEYFSFLSLSYLVE